MWTPQKVNLAFLDLIQILDDRQILDKCFGNACDLDSIFQVVKIHNILGKLVMGVGVGLGLETNMNEAVT